jgi:hypothetical protein
MKRTAILVALFSILLAGFSFAQTEYPLGVANTLQMAGVDLGTVTSVESFQYGPFIIGASGEEYLPPAERDRWYEDIWRSNENQILIMGATYDPAPFPNKKMNSSLNHLLGSDRRMLGFEFALPKARMGQIRMVLLMEPFESTGRYGLMYRVTSATKAKPATATASTVDTLKGVIVELRKQIDTLRAMQQKPEEETTAPYDGIHVCVGFAAAGAINSVRTKSKENLSNDMLSVSISIKGDWELGYIGGGAYENQGGHGFFLEKYVATLVSARDASADVFIGSSLSIFRKLDQTESPRSIRLGQLYGGFKVNFGMFGRRHPLHVVGGWGTNFEVRTTKDGGLQFIDHRLGVMMRLAYTL